MNGKILRFFSSDSFDFNPNNTSSEFTIKLDEEIQLQEPFEVGVVQLYLNEIQNNPNFKVLGRDMVSLRSKEPISHFKNFVHTVLDCSHSPFLYNHAYFGDYFDKNIFMSVKSLEKIFPGDVTTITNITKSGAENTQTTQTIIKFPIKELLQNGEKFEDFLPTFTINRQELENSQVVIRFDNKRTYSMRQILFRTITTFLKVYLGGNEEFHEHVEFFLKNSNNKDLTDQRRQHFELAHKLTLRLVSKFVDSIMDYQKELKEKTGEKNTEQIGAIDAGIAANSKRRKREVAENQTDLKKPSIDVTIVKPSTNADNGEDMLSAPKPIKPTVINSAGAFKPKRKQKKKKDSVEILPIIAPPRKETIDDFPEIEEEFKPKFLMIYSDLIEPVISGSSRNRIIYTTLTDNFLKPQNIFMNTIQYHRVEKTKFSDITFSFRDEHGELIKFKDSGAPNFIALHLKPIVYKI
jgi:hypothetical protein